MKLINYQGSVYVFSIISTNRYGLYFCCYLWEKW